MNRFSAQMAGFSTSIFSDAVHIVIAIPNITVYLNDDFKLILKKYLKIVGNEILLMNKIKGNNID